MKKLLAGFSLALIASPAFAQAAPQVPEMSAGAGIAAIALLAGVASLLRDRNK